jgi:hypothetical protein
MAVYLATRREVNTQAPQLSHGREAALKKGKRKPEKPASPPHRRILGHACPGKKLFPGHVPLGHVRHALINASITTIESKTFAMCSSLHTVSIPESVTTIESCAFEGCTSLLAVTVPAGATVRYRAFEDTTTVTIA